ncbi:hypothetical protein L1987_06745 [Smallanthus sonchifolius]|uniref:Uncharacterized protein n=1 Tax=Smallanthus sonchifolius TaxID=185202 RepID=A0ACB9JZ28_9ASTR|nr:hypothetical protein L1987_06745 [Smallanthus sonchifolius]
MPHEEEPGQVSESEPEEETEEELVGDAEGANFDTDSGETVPYSITYVEDTSSEERALSSTDTELLPKRHCLLNQLEFEVSSHQLQGMVDLADLALWSLHGRVAVGETRLTAVEHEVIAAEQRNERVNERLDSFAALTIVNTMLLAFVLLEDGSLRFTISAHCRRAVPT